jgi:hypothetical protein
MCGLCATVLEVDWLEGATAGVIPETILRWYRELIARKYDGSARRSPTRTPMKRDNDSLDLSQPTRLAIERPRQVGEVVTLRLVAARTAQPTAPRRPRCHARRSRGTWPPRTPGPRPHARARPMRSPRPGAAACGPVQQRVAQRKSPGGGIRYRWPRGQAFEHERDVVPQERSLPIASATYARIESRCSRYTNTRPARRVSSQCSRSCSRGAMEPTAIAQSIALGGEPPR